MAASHWIIIFMATIVVLATSISAKEYIVGDGSGWTLDFDYQAWAKDKVFMVGDTLGMFILYTCVFHTLFTMLHVSFFTSIFIIIIFFSLYLLPFYLPLWAHVSYIRSYLMK